MILACHHINKSFNENSILKDASFFIEEKDKVAIVGINGAGKTTLLNIISGKISADSGEVVTASDVSIGYLEQHQDFSLGSTIYDEVYNSNHKILSMESQLRNYEADMSQVSGDELSDLMDKYNRLTHEFELVNGYAYRSEVVGVLKGLGFNEDEFDIKTNELSGGLKTRISLAKLLLLKPDIIMLDEPTNHLDISSVSWLEDYLKNYPGTVIVIAHDRYFLDKLANKVIEIDAGCVTIFDGNYSAYAIKKESLREAALKEYLNTMAYIKHQEKVIEKLHSFNREKSVKRARSREKQLEKIDRPDKPTEVKADMNLEFSTGGVRSGDDVLITYGLSKSFDEVLFNDVSLEIKRGERIAICGDNGTGKTTFLKIINGLVSADSGDFRLGTNVTIGYYDQEQQLLDDSKTVFDEVHDAYPTLTNTQVRNTLAAFLFTGDDVFKEVKSLSGGERGRLSLAKLILSPCNFLILDEPTNHLDMVSKEVLENALLNYEGTLLFVSHDRYFINKIADRVLELCDKHFDDYKGDYEYFLEKKAEGVYYRENDTACALPIKDTANTAPAPAPVANDWKAQKEEAARLRKLANDKAKIEAEIDSLEARSAEIDELMTHEDVYTNVSECVKLHNEQEEIKARIDELFEKWEELED